MEGKTARGASSPAKPALHMPEPLSTTRAATSSSHILSVLSGTGVVKPGDPRGSECEDTGPDSAYIAAQDCCGLKLAELQQNHHCLIR